MSNPTLSTKIHQFLKSILTQIFYFLNSVSYLLFISNLSLELKLLIVKRRRLGIKNWSLNRLWLKLRLIGWNKLWSGSRDILRLLWLIGWDRNRNILRLRLIDWSSRSWSLWNVDYGHLQVKALRWIRLMRHSMVHMNLDLVLWFATTRTFFATFIATIKTKNKHSNIKNNKNNYCYHFWILNRVESNLQI